MCKYNVKYKIHILLLNHALAWIALNYFNVLIWIVIVYNNFTYIKILKY
jgi:hypothetical protein